MGVLIDLIVLSKFPRLVVLMVATCLMGHTSKVYYQAITKRFCLFDNAAGAASRLMNYSLVFNRFADKETQAISKATVAKELTVATKLERKDSHMEADELLGFVNFCYTSMLSPPEHDPT